MKTEQEFNQKLKICLRRARKKRMPQIIANKMNIYPGVYFAMETGMIKLSVYQLYCFMHAAGQDTEFIKQIFDDAWAPPSMYKTQVADAELDCHVGLNPPRDDNE